MTDLTPAQVHGSWRARHRASNIERMAKAIYDWQSSQLIPGDRPPWPDCGPLEREGVRGMAEAAYDAL